VVTTIENKLTRKSRCIISLHADNAEGTILVHVQIDRITFGGWFARCTNAFSLAHARYS
jgi:hypothetical protein